MDPVTGTNADNLLQLVERSAFIGFWRLDAKQGHLYWSEQLARLHGAPSGYTPTFENALGHFAEEHRAELEARMRACQEQGVPFDIEVQLNSMQGRRIWVRCVGQPLTAADGSLAGAEGLVQEIAPPGYAPGTLMRHTVSMGGALGSGEAFVTIDAQGRISYANEQAEQLLASDALSGRKIWSFFQKRARLALEERFIHALERREAIELEEMDAQVSHWLELRGFPFGGTGLALHLRDVTARRRAQQHLMLLEGSIARLNDIVIITEAAPFRAPGPRIVFVNEAFERRTGYAREEVIGQSPRLLQGPDTQRPQLDRIRAALEQWERVRVDLINYTKAGEPYWVDLDVSPVWDEARRLTHWVAVGRDITERKRDEEKIQYLAFYDPLTQLPNRQMLLDRLNEAVGPSGHAHEGALMFIDLDNFKVLNDTLGHQKGDLLLQQVARRLRNCVAKGDLVARLGGDEFVVLLENRPDKPLDPITAAEVVSQRILEGLGEPYVLPGYLHHSTCSIGVTLFGKAPSSVNELLKQADLAMYQAKAAGRNAVRFFDPEMQAVASANAALATDLRQAWRDNNLKIEYQPQVGMDGRMFGVEALLRWEHPTRGIVRPDEFIPTAEETSLIIPIGHWVLEAACAQLAEWGTRPDRSHLSIAVNVSVRQFRHPDFIDEVMTCVRRAGIRPDRLKLELTESLLADNLDSAIAKMRNLKDMGVRLSVDDFGIGYSSLSYLKRLPIDELKIDRAFVKDILSDHNDAAIAATIIGLCRSLGLEVIAEGVETEEQRAFLARQGCERYQGYLYCRPLPLPNLEAFMDAHPGPGAPVTPEPSSVAS
ncbi:EAL domain-containing protein [Ramlibacter sp. PS3R-8]|uniref:sensor domain-containing protein n=1 Tax=Ramlibacter sp. PS3R-8 TaxID=3133437 RepID=UPI0030B4EE18